jgi:hypothetical protein
MNAIGGVCGPGCPGYVRGNDIATLRVARIALVTR